MEFKKVISIDGPAHFLADSIISRLELGLRVFWLIPGGSAISIAVKAGQLLAGYDCSKLVISLTDERYGSVGHKDSNWQQLIDASFEIQKSTPMPVLSDLEFDKTIELYDEGLQREFKKADYKIGFFGIGPDGHTAGILPDSPAVDAAGWAVGYSANFERITMTGQAIGMLDEAVVYAVGENKWPVLDDLERKIDIAQQPAQLLKRVPQLTIFNDYKGEQV